MLNDPVSKCGCENRRWEALLALATVGRRRQPRAVLVREVRHGDGPTVLPLVRRARLVVTYTGMSH